MGFWDTITDLVEAAAPWSTADAEAPEAAPEESKVRSNSALCGQLHQLEVPEAPEHTLVASLHAA